MPTVFRGIYLTAGRNTLGQRIYTQTYHVETERRTVGARAVLAAVKQVYGVDVGVRFRHYHPGHPDYEYDDGAICTDIQARTLPDSVSQAWEVAASYGPYDPEFVRPDNPLEIPILITWGAARVEDVLDRDIDLDGKPIVNAAGEPFIDPIPIARSYEVLKVKRYEQSYDPELAASYRDSVNNADWTVQGRKIPATWAKCDRVESEPQYHPDIGKFYISDYEFQINPKGWRFQVVNQGLRQRSGSTTVPIMRGNLPIVTPALLDANGVPLPFPLPTGTAPVYLTFKGYPEKDFSVFNFPTEAE